jgi:hypothetical protein
MATRNPKALHVHDPKALYVFAWAGDLLDTPSGKKKLGYLKWENPRFRYKLKKNTSKVFYGSPRPLVKNFFTSLVSQEAHPQILAYLKRLEWLSSNINSFDTLDAKYQKKYGGTDSHFDIGILYEKDNTPPILGLALNLMSGIKLNFNHNKKSPIEYYYDIFSVFQMKKVQGKWTAVGIQGLLIPVDKRSHLFDKFQEQSLQAAIGSIFARNYAHNIGAHVKLRTTLPKIKDRIAKLYATSNL